MCTLDPLGYAYSQCLALPFLVLDRAIEQMIENPSEAHKQALDLVQDTCIKMILHNKKKKARECYCSKIRTEDVLPALSVLLV